MDELRILILPPTRRDGQVSQALLEQAGLTCLVCGGAVELASEILKAAGAILMTDAALSDPHIGVVLDALSAQPDWSDIPTVLLTRGGSQAAAAAHALTALTNVSLLERPTSTWTLISCVQAAIRGRRRQYQTREQLRALAAAEEALRIADHRKDQFLAMLAHELRNPLAPIRTAAELLARSLPGDPGMQTVAAIVTRQAGHLTRLVDDLLDVSRITQDRIELQRSPLELSAIVDQAMESVDASIRERGHTVVRASSLKPLYVNGDRERLVQCVANILTNAVKYTDTAGEIRIQVHEDHGSAVVTIKDNGIGIPADLLPRVFDLFVQSDRSLDRADGGLGIGLSVVQRLVEMHGGQVSAHSAGVGAGATFEIRLPLIAVPIAAAVESARPRLPPHRILIVDDNVDAAEALAMILQLEGHTTELAFDGREGLSRAAVFRPDTVLLDIGLPTMNGYEVARTLRADTALSGIRLIALTGYGQAEDKRHALEAGFDAHLVKPVEYAALADTLASTP
ncbi:MAG: ATP-binding protein [Steroidobacteraceae bacterium]